MSKRHLVAVCAAAAIAVCSNAAFAAPVVSIDSYAKSDSAAARADFAALSGSLAQKTVEGFEGFTSWADGSGGTPNPVSTAVGSFSAVSAIPGSGGSIVNGGTGLEVRDEVPMFGRSNLTEGGSNWLDSNDLISMVWQTAGSFDSLAFFLTDVGDIRGTDFTVTISGAGFSDMISHIAPQVNGTINLVNILFDSVVSDITVTLTSQHNDGFGIDEALVGSSVAPVPLPAAGMLLLAGLGGLALRGRRTA